MLASSRQQNPLPLEGFASPNPFAATKTDISPYAPRLSDASLRFAVMGDAGTGTKAQFDVANQMTRWRTLLPFNSVLVLGDNVYQHGEPQYFFQRIFRPYRDLFAQGVKFYPVLGNHDVNRGYGDMQLAYWGVPPCYNFKLGPKGSDVEFWAIDTTVMAPGESDCYVNNPFVACQREARQMAWLEQSLAKSTASMKVVYGHYPLYSVGADCKDSRKGVQAVMAQKLVPLFQKYGVDAYMAGHEHHYEKPRMVNGVYYLVSGSGGKLDTPQRGGPEGNGLLKRLHFMLFEITPQGLAYRTISEQGQLLDTGLIPRKNNFTLQLQVTG